MIGQRVNGGATIVPTMKISVGEGIVWDGQTTLISKWAMSLQ